MSNFKEFWFEGNQYSGYVKCESDLNELFKSHEDYMSSDEVLDKSCNSIHDSNIFGLRIEHMGNITLRMFLRECKIDKLLEDA